MQSVAAKGSLRIVILVAIAAAALSACIIGPKQDDPAPTGANVTDTGVGALDSSAAEDLEGGKTSDSSDIPPPADTMAVPMADVGASDTSCSADADGGDACVRDGAAGDAVTDVADGG